MDDLFIGVLPYLPGVPFGLALVVIYRLYITTVRDLREARKDYRDIQRDLDTERVTRRKAEDEVAKLTREINGSRTGVRRPRKRSGEVTT